MPLENRVDPFGVIFRTPARGTFMGNRGGPLHNERREIVRSFKSKCWLICRLEFNGRHRAVMSPRRYTELFFLDEAVALAAGHRPCFECRRERFNAFRAAWQATPSPRAADIDAELHRSRIDKQGKQITYDACLDSLPIGSFVQIDGLPHLVWNEMLLLWTPERYAESRRRDHRLAVTVLTPRPIVECLRRGYTPEIHQSAHACAR